MDMELVHHPSGKRLQLLAIKAETFEEERFLTLLFNAIISGGHVKIVQGKPQDEGMEFEDDFGDLLEEDGYVIKFGY